PSNPPSSSSSSSSSFSSSSSSSPAAALSKAEFLDCVRRSNQACQQGEFGLAERLYGDALASDPQNPILYSNRSAARIRLGQYGPALEDALQARIINPKWPKVRRYRRVTCCRARSEVRPVIGLLTAG
ncbi:unnamed protein product, partial [Menidia menidia]